MNKLYKVFIGALIMCGGFVISSYLLNSLFYKTVQSKPALLLEATAYLKSIGYISALISSIIAASFIACLIIKSGQKYLYAYITTAISYLFIMLTVYAPQGSGDYLSFHAIYLGFAIITGTFLGVRFSYKIRLVAD